VVAGDFLNYVRAACRVKIRGLYTRHASRAQVSLNVPSPPLSLCLSSFGADQLFRDLRRDLRNSSYRGCGRRRTANGAFSALADAHRAAALQTTASYGIHFLLPPLPIFCPLSNAAGTARDRATSSRARDETTRETSRGKSGSPRRIRLPRLPSSPPVSLSVSRRNMHDRGARGHNVHTGEKRVEGRAASFYATVPSE